jgi:hypothetical protein
VEALETIGAPETAAICERAIASLELHLGKSPAAGRMASSDAGSPAGNAATFRGGRSRVFFVSSRSHQVAI